MHRFISQNAQHLPYIIRCHFCCFNQNDKAEILKGFKNKISPEEAMTGEEFCQLLELNYDDLINERKKLSKGNMTYFLSELIKIDFVKNWLKKHFG